MGSNWSHQGQISAHLVIPIVDIICYEKLVSRKKDDGNLTAQHRSGDKKLVEKSGGRGGATKLVADEYVG